MHNDDHNGISLLDEALGPSARAGGHSNGMADCYDGIVDCEAPQWDEEAWAIASKKSRLIEFDWFAIDDIGQLGAFSSFGTGPSPRLVFESRPRFNRLLLAIARLDNSVEWTIEEPAYGDTSSWEAYAKRGLFAFDNANAHAIEPRNTYRPVAWPCRPLRLVQSSIPRELWSALPRLDCVFEPGAPISFRLCSG